MDGDTRCHRDCCVGGCAVVLALGEEVRAALRELHKRAALVQFELSAAGSSAGHHVAGSR